MVCPAQILWLGVTVPFGKGLTTTVVDSGVDEQEFRIAVHV